MCDHDKKANSSLHNPHKEVPTASLNDAHHNEEHSTWNRRSFLQALGLVGGGTMMLGGSNLTAAAPSRLAAALAQAENNDRVLVLIRLKGGNDGLNTIVPLYDYDYYANSRPTIRHTLSTIYPLSDDIGIPKYMDVLAGMWGDGAMKVAHGVGYGDQNFSHFRSSDIWASAQSQEVENTGVFGRYFEGLYPDYLVNPPEEPLAIQIGSQGNLIFDGDEAGYAFSVANPGQLASIAENGNLHDVENLPECTYGNQLGYMRGVINTTLIYAGVINDAYENATNSVEYQDANLGRQLAIVARMIKGGLSTKIYMVTLGGFDTHANQMETHENRMNQVARGMTDFFADLAATGHDQNVLGMTFSEFGRRIEENGSNGTDHGAASPVLLFGPALEGNGFIGEHPDMQNPDQYGNLQFGTDFRSIYGSVMRDWLCIDGGLVDELLFNTYPALDLGFSCETLTTEEFSVVDPFKHQGVYINNQTYVQFTMPQAAKVDVKLFNILGQEVGTITNDFLFEGTHRFGVKESLRKRLFSGQYIYQIAFGGKKYSASILVR